jgi:hypothetical protein
VSSGSEELAPLAKDLVAKLGKAPITGVVVDGSYYSSNLRVPGIEDDDTACDAECGAGGEISTRGGACNHCASREPLVFRRQIFLCLSQTNRIIKLPATTAYGDRTSRF